MAIKLKDIWPIENVLDYKVHFARHNGEVEPLDDWLEDTSNWVAWQQHRPANNAFNRKFIFSLMKFYREPNTWLFGGVFRVRADRGDRYEVKLTHIGEAFIGRLKVYRAYPAKAPRVNLENHYEDMEVSEVLREPYSG